MKNFQTDVEKIKIYCIFSFCKENSALLLDNVKKFGRARQATDGGNILVIRGRKDTICKPDTCGKNTDAQS
jgi:hypothetical protein